ncbi:tyrosine-type recombinase/integrase [Vannielia sp. SX4]|uniref:tyrosine-type recombinase/integrase n=1 Tax=Vannielia sp. SX4 TaxID=3463852 RepID=UPI004058B42B
MHVRLKGLNTVKSKLADGTYRTYYYAWKGGPRLPGAPGDPEFMAAYQKAIDAKLDTPSGTLAAVLNAYRTSRRFEELASRTKRDYEKHLRRIEAEYGTFPIAALTDRRTRGEFLTWRDALATKSRRQADYTYSVLALVLSWAQDRGLVPSNPCERPGRTYRSRRVESVWKQEDEARFMQAAPPHLRLAFLLALWTGQRQGDLLRLTWSAFDGECIRLKQSKTGVRVTIPVGKPLLEALNGTEKTAVTILTTVRNTAWTESGFRASWRTACKAAGVEGLTFHDLRGTAVTRLALARCTTPEIATITGHSLKQVETILDAHYLSRDAKLALSAIRKREAHETGTGFPK